MTYGYFKLLAKTKGWTIRQLRCDDAPPTADLEELMNALGLTRYERFVLKLEKELATAAK